MSEEIDYKGYTITIEQDEFAGNPFEEQGADELPLLVYYEGFVRYAGAPDTDDIMDWMPADVFRKNLPEMLSWFDVDKDEFAKDCEHWGSAKSVITHYIDEDAPESTKSWSTAETHMERISSLLGMIGIKHYWGRSNGHCQGDSAMVMAIATNYWVERTGAPLDSLEEQCKASVELYGCWAWGDVYCITSVTDPEGEEVEDGTIGGFYGYDHEKSGLMDHVRWCVDRDIEDKLGEEKSRLYWETRDVVTV